MEASPHGAEIIKDRLASGLQNGEIVSQANLPHRDRTSDIGNSDEIPLPKAMGQEIVNVNICQELNHAVRTRTFHDLPALRIAENVDGRKWERI